MIAYSIPAAPSRPTASQMYTKPVRQLSRILKKFLKDYTLNIIPGFDGKERLDFIFNRKFTNSAVMHGSAPALRRQFADDGCAEDADRADDFIAVQRLVQHERREQHGCHRVEIAEDGKRLRGKRLH